MEDIPIQKRARSFLSSQKCQEHSIPTNMDPLQILPEELILYICSFLDVSDLMHVWELNHSWRQIVTDHSLWRDYELELRGSVDPHPYRDSDHHMFDEYYTPYTSSDISLSLKVLRRAPCLSIRLFSEYLILTKKQRQALVETKAMVSRIDLDRAGDQDLTLQLIQNLRPHLEEVVVKCPSCELLNKLISLPKLTKLSVEGGGIRCKNKPFKQTTRFMGRLKVFEDLDLEKHGWSLPSCPLVSILKAYSSTLEIVTLSDLRGRLVHLLTLLRDECEFKALRQLVIHDFCPSTEKLVALRHLFPGVDVLVK